MNNTIREMLLIEEPSIFRLYKELSSIFTLFIGPLFLLGLVVEFFGNFDFLGVIKKLVIVSLVITSFYGLHKKSVEIAFDVANKTLKKVSPQNLFAKRWNRVSLSKKKVVSKNAWEYVKNFAIPNMNDLVASSFFVFSSVFILMLKFIYSTVYHLTYVFAGFTALLYFFGWTNKSLIGTFQSSLWCIILPFVLVAMLSLIGNSFDERALEGSLIVAEIQTIIWLFGVSLMLLLTPMITWMMVKGEGVASSGSKMGSLSILAGTRMLSAMPIMKSLGRKGIRSISRAGNRFSNLKNSSISNGGNRTLKSSNLKSSTSSARGVYETHNLSKANQSTNKQNLSKSEARNVHTSNKQPQKKVGPEKSIERSTSRSLNVKRQNSFEKKISPVNSKPRSRTEDKRSSVRAASKPIPTRNKVTRGSK
jgi:hypothetical protein